MTVAEAVAASGPIPVPPNHANSNHVRKTARLAKPAAIKAAADRRALAGASTAHRPPAATRPIDSEDLFMKATAILVFLVLTGAGVAQLIESVPAPKTTHSLQFQPHHPPALPPLPASQDPRNFRAICMETEPDGSGYSFGYFDTLGFHDDFIVLESMTAGGQYGTPGLYVASLEVLNRTGEWEFLHLQEGWPVFQAQPAGENNYLRILPPGFVLEAGREYRWNADITGENTPDGGCLYGYEDTQHPDFVHAARAENIRWPNCVQDAQGNQHLDELDGDRSFVITSFQADPNAGRVCALNAGVWQTVAFIDYLNPTIHYELPVYLETPTRLKRVSISQSCEVQSSADCIPIGGYYLD